jgi:serine/threonine protein kinase
MAMDASFEADLESFLGAVADRYEPRQVLKSTQSEKTEMVWRQCGPDGATVGPFVRKTFTCGTSRGSAYEDMLRAQVKGHHLAHQPFLYECEHIDENLQVIMQYVRGQDLHEVVDYEGPSMELTRKVMPELCDAVTELHESFEHPIIHRDIKPSNVMVSSSGLKLIDLGIARSYRTGASHDTERLGTPGYAPPEQFGYGQTDVRSDVYALGMTCAFCLTGEDPTARLIEEGFTDTNIPERVRGVLQKACAFDPQGRYASAHAFKDALIEAIDDTSEPTGTTNTAKSAPVADDYTYLSPEEDARQKTDDASIATAEAQAPSLAKNVFGSIWDVTVIEALLVSYGGIYSAIIHPNGTLANQPTWATAAQYIFIIGIPFTCIAYCLLYKAHVRKWLGPLGTISKRREILYAVVASLLSILVGFIFLRIFQP